MKKCLCLMLIIALLISLIVIPVNAVDVELSSVGTTQKAMFIMDNLNISQGMYGSYSHQGSKAIDLAGKDSGKDPAYAPFDGKVVYISTSDAYIIYESLNPVEYADGTVDYMTVWVMHDDNVGRFYVGQTFSQGEHFFDEGSSGYATGNHIHLECAKGTYARQYQNSYGVWCLNNQINPYDALYLSDTTNIINGYDYNWRRTNTEPTPDFTPVDVGTDFYANICNIPTYKRVAVAGTNVELKSANGDDSQKWKFERLDDTLYKITNVATGMCMEVSNFGTEDRTNIQVMPWADNDAQKWYFKIVRDGCYSLVPKCAVNSCIDTYGYFDDNTNIQLYHQNATDAQTFALNTQPAFEARNIGNSFVASIIHPSSDMAVTYDLSWNVIINPHSNAKSQQWLFEIMDDRSYKITNLASNMCLDVSNFGTANGTNIQLMPSADNIAQRWFIKAVGNGYSLVPKCACESAIDIDGVIKDGGNNIQLFRQNSYLNQIFSIRRVIDDNMVSVSDVVLNNNSEAVNPQISVKVDNTILKADSDYSVTIEADTTQEKGTVTITGINNYCGNVTKSFSIAVIAQTEPTTPPTTPPTEPSVIKLGDVDGDDEVTIIDATCIQRKLASIATAKFVEAAADTDKDGELTIIDATVIQRWLAQLPTNENIGKPSIT